MFVLPHNHIPNTTAQPRPTTAEQMGCADVETGKISYNKVDRVYIKSSDVFYNLKTNGTENIRVTGSHLFFTNSGWWIAAEHLKANDQIMTAQGTYEVIDSIEAETSDDYELIYNLNVQNDHTYFVGTGGLLVHNDCTEGMTNVARKVGEMPDADAIIDGLTDVTAAEAQALGRPTWRQSEIDAQVLYPDYDPQKSFFKKPDGEIVEVPYGTKGSVRPDYYKPGHSVDVKNYNVTTEQGRSNLVNNIKKQYLQRLESLPAGTNQTVVIDVRGQMVNKDLLSELEDAIHLATENMIEIKIRQ